MPQPGQSGLGEHADRASHDAEGVRKLATLLYIVSLDQLVQDLEDLESRRKEQLRSLVSEFISDQAVAAAFTETLGTEASDKLSKLAGIVA
jgi:hypothetical protein